MKFANVFGISNVAIGTGVCAQPLCSRSKTILIKEETDTTIYFWSTFRLQCFWWKGNKHAHKQYWKQIPQAPRIAHRRRFARTPVCPANRDLLGCLKDKCFQLIIILCHLLHILLWHLFWLLLRLQCPQIDSVCCFFGAKGGHPLFSGFTFSRPCKWSKKKQKDDYKRFDQLGADKTAQVNLQLVFVQTAR